MHVFDNGTGIGNEARESDRVPARHQACRRCKEEYRRAGANHEVLAGIEHRSGRRAVRNGDCQAERPQWAAAHVAGVRIGDAGRVSPRPRRLRRLRSP